MGKGSGKAIAVIALLISIGLGGYIIYDKFIAAPQTTISDTPTTNQYLRESSTLLIIPSAEQWTSGYYILIEFDITDGQSVYFSFEGVIRFRESSIPDTYIELRFKVDGIIWTYPHRKIERQDVVSPWRLEFSAAMQYYYTSMSSGTHNVTVVCRGDHTIDRLGSRSLFVQTFN